MQRNEWQKQQLGGSGAAAVTTLGKTHTVSEGPDGATKQSVKEASIPPGLNQVAGS